MIKELTKKFLDENPGYTNDVSKIIEYLDLQKPPSPFYSEFTIRGMTVDVIIDSLKYNITTSKQIQKKETARKYVTAVGQLFETLLDKHPNLKNETLKKQLGAPIGRADSYMRLCTEFIDNCSELSEKESFDALSDNAVSNLLEKCNISIEKCLTENQVFSERIIFRNMLSALCIKLVLATGVTYRVLRLLKISDFDTRCGTLDINDYKIRLPLMLSFQIQRYITCLEKAEFQDSPEYLFVDFDGKQWGETTSTSGIPHFLKTQLQESELTDEIKYGITHLVKYGITQLMLNDVSNDIIAELTGASEAIISSCHAPNSRNAMEWYSYINSKIVNTDFYKKDCLEYIQSNQS